MFSTGNNKLFFLSIPLNFLLIFSFFITPLYSADYQEELPPGVKRSEYRQIKETINKIKNSETVDEIAEHYVSLKNTLASKGIYLPSFTNAYVDISNKLKDHGVEIDYQTVQSFDKKVEENESSHPSLKNDTPKKQPDGNLHGEDLQRRGYFKLTIGALFCFGFGIGLFVGVPLLISGARDLKRYKREKAEDEQEAYDQAMRSHYEYQNEQPNY